MVPVSNFCLERWTPPATVERHSRHQIPCTTIFEIDCDDVSLYSLVITYFPRPYRCGGENTEHNAGMSSHSVTSGSC